MKFDNAYRREKNKKNYDFVQIFFSKNDNIKERIEDISKKQGLSKNAFIKKAIEKEIYKYYSEL